MIKAFLCDLDGTLTDGCYFIFSDYEGISKKLNTRDFYGMMMLANAGIACSVVTSSCGSVLYKQVERISFPLKIYTAVCDKKKFVYDLLVSGSVLSNKNITWDEIAYIGDDVNDLELLDCVGMAACPVDAEADVIDLIENRKDGWVINCKGGEGCVRKFANLILGMV